jgi:hypothetical protein
MDKESVAVEERAALSARQQTFEAYPSRESQLGLLQRLDDIPAKSIAR